MSLAPFALPVPHVIPTRASCLSRLVSCVALLASPVTEALAETEALPFATCDVESMDPSASALPGVVGVTFRPLERVPGAVAAADSPGFEIALVDASGRPSRTYLGLGTLKGKTAQVTTYSYVTDATGAPVRGAKNGRFFLEQGRTGWFTMRGAGDPRLEISFAGCRWSNRR